MNEIKKCSISGISFTLETDAYHRLNDYLASLKKAYKNDPDGKEITADIEARIAELILSAQRSAEQTVCLPLIENIIAQLGDAEDISGSADADEPIKSDTRIPRRLYRDVGNAKLGGVCAGLGRYFNVDAVWIRLGLFTPLLLSWILYNTCLSSIFGHLFLMFCVAYIVAWFAIPAAQSARQKLEMNGEPITASSIRNTTTSATQEQKAKSAVASIVTTLGIIIGVLLKIFVVMLALPLIFVCVMLLIALFGLIFGMGGALASMADFGNLNALFEIAGAQGGAVAALVILLCLIPAAVLLYIFIALVLGKRPRLWIMLSSLIVWIVLIIATVLTSVRTIGSMSESEVDRIMATVESLDEGDIAESKIDSLEYARLLNATDVPSADK